MLCAGEVVCSVHRTATTTSQLWGYLRTAGMCEDMKYSGDAACAVYCCQVRESMICCGDASLTVLQTCSVYGSTK